MFSRDELAARGTAVGDAGELAFGPHPRQATCHPPELDLAAALPQAGAMIHAIDHIVLTVRDIDVACAFYADVLGVEIVTFGAGRRALQIGAQKINLQSLGQETRNHAAIGCGDVCLLTDRIPEQVVAHLTARNVAIVEGPVEKTGARGRIVSVYFNDPDGNLIEISSYPPDD